MNYHNESNLFVIGLSFFVFGRVQSSFTEVGQRDGAGATEGRFVGRPFHAVRLHRIASRRVVLIFRVAQTEIRRLLRLVQIRFAVGRQNNDLLT